MARSAWIGIGTPDLRHRHSKAEQRLVERLEWAERQIDLPAGRYQVLLPPDAVADLVLMLGDATSGRDAEEGRSVFSAPGGGTRIGETLSEVGLRPEKRTRQSRGSSASPSWSPTASRSDVSVFDNGMALDPTALGESGTARALQVPPGRGAKIGHDPRAADRQPGARGSPGATESLDSMIARTDRASAAHLPLVHPRGRPIDTAAHRAHPRRRLPGGTRRDRRVQ